MTISQPLPIFNWQKEIDKMSNDPNVSIRYLNVSEVNGYGLFVSIIPPGEANTGHYHPEEAEKYHIVKGKGFMLSQHADELESSKLPVRQDVEEGMTVDLPALVAHRLVNDSKDDLIFFFECPMIHMDPVDPVRTVVKDFGGTIEVLTDQS